MQPKSISKVVDQKMGARGVMFMPSAYQTFSQTPVLRYSNWAVTFHWVTVALVLAQAYLGFAFAWSPEGQGRMELFLWHKTTGALILLITLARLAYRVVNPPPTFSPDLPAWERSAATWSHRLFYFLLIAMPLSGLVAVSAHAKGATTPLIGGIPLPVFPGVSRHLGEVAGDTHVVLVAILLIAIAIHVAAALKHQFYDHIPAAGRMPPFQPGQGMPTAIGQGHRARA
jgi:cytochrome b561